MKIGLVSEKPDVKDEARFTIDQSASLLGVHKNTIKNWMTKGIFKPREWGFRKANGRRYITGRALKRVWLETY